MRESEGESKRERVCERERGRERQHATHTLAQTLRSQKINNINLTHDPNVDTCCKKHICPLLRALLMCASLSVRGRVTQTQL